MKDYPDYTETDSNQANTLANNAASNEGLKALSQLGEELINENRRIRRGRWIGRILMVLFLLAIFVLPQYIQGNALVQSTTPHTALIKLEGVVMSGAGVDSELTNPSLRQAFAAKQAKGIILQINSPGGSPVQAERIYDEIMRLKAIYPDKKVIAVIEDFGRISSLLYRCRSR